MYFGKSSHAHLSEIHFLILFWEMESEELFFISPGNRSHILVPKLKYFQLHIALFVYSFMIKDQHSLNCKFHFPEKLKFSSSFL